MKIKLISILCSVTNIFANSQLFNISFLGQLTPLIPPTIAANHNPLEIIISPDGLNVYVNNLYYNTISQYSRNPLTGVLSELNPVVVQTEYGGGSIAMSPDGKNVYATNQGEDMFANGILSQYSRNDSSGQLIKLATTFNTGNQPISITISPDGKNVYIANFGSNEILQYKRNQLTGLLTELVPSIVNTENGPNIIIVSPDGKNLYVSNYLSCSLSQFNRDETTGLLTKVGNAENSQCLNLNGMVISPDGANVYTSETDDTLSQFKRNLDTGQLTKQISINSNPNPGDIIISPDGKNLYVTNYEYNKVAKVSQYSIDKKNGSLTPLTNQDIPIGVSATRIAISPDGLNVYVTNYDGDMISQFSRFLSNE